MKEATGELNASVIVVVAIAGLSAFFFGVIWPLINSNLQNTSKCSDALCDPTTEVDGTVQCDYYKTTFTIGDQNSLHVSDTPETIRCPFKG